MSRELFASFALQFQMLQKRVDSFACTKVRSSAVKQPGHGQRCVLKFKLGTRVSVEKLRTYGGGVHSLATIMYTYSKTIKVHEYNITQLYFCRCCPPPPLSTVPFGAHIIIYIYEIRSLLVYFFTENNVAESDPPSKVHETYLSYAIVRPVLFR